MKGVLIGRVCPVHLGHEAVIKAMLEKFGKENCLMGIGSSNHTVSLRHFFSYQERRGFLRLIFPELKIFGLADYSTDEEWMTALDDILLVSGINPKGVIFFGGCREDVEFFYRFGRKVEIMNRYDGSTPDVSASKVRDALIEGRSLNGLVNPIVIEPIWNCFRDKWEHFKKI